MPGDCHDPLPNRRPSWMLLGHSIRGSGISAFQLNGPAHREAKKYRFSIYQEPEILLNDSHAFCVLLHETLT